MELLSPAGDFSALKAAVFSGADAVYFGGSCFNARINANNFDNNSVQSAIDFCHERDCFAYITLNTIIADLEYKSALEYAAFLYNCGVDAVIVQDLGLVAGIRRYIPELAVHASTQMGISSLSGVLSCKELGMKRVVLSRETPLYDIIHITENCDMPIECFVHGAMCVSFSGGCLFSSMVGDRRSGNLGLCAQPCRKKYCFSDLPEKMDYLLSMSDLCMLEHIDELKKAGICSLKIEGRMKKPEYVACVTRAYREAIDGADKKEIQRLKKELFNTFNRGDFTTGYYFGDNAKIGGKASASPEKNSCFADIEKKTKISMSLELIPDFPAKLTASINDKENDEIVVFGDLCQIPQSPISLERYCQSLKKLGDTPFFCDEPTLNIKGFLPVSSVNDLRRNAASALLEKKHVRHSVSIDVNKQRPKKTVLNREHKAFVKVISEQQLVAAIESSAYAIILDSVMFTDAELICFAKKINASGKLSFVALPIAEFGSKISTVFEMPFYGFEVNNLGQLSLAKKTGKKIIAGSFMNVYNSETAKELLKMGACLITMSVEQAGGMLRDCCTDIGGKAIINVYGRTTLMNLFHCPKKERIGCKKCRENEFAQLTDEGNRHFIMLPELGKKANCNYVRLLNCYPLNIIDKSEISTLDCDFYYSFYDESGDELLFVLNGKKSIGEFTRGYFFK